MINKGKVYINKDKKNKRISPDDIDEYVSRGWAVGRYQRPLNIKRMYNSNTGELKNVDISEVDKYKLDGWLLGCNYSTNNGRIYITKNKKNKMIKPDELDFYIKNGWRKGMYNKKYNNENEN